MPLVYHLYVYGSSIRHICGFPFSILVFKKIENNPRPFWNTRPQLVKVFCWCSKFGSCWVAGACHAWSGLRWGCQVPLPPNGHRLRQSANPSKLRNRRLVICWHTIELGFLCILEKLTMPNVSWDVTSLTCLIKLSQKLENFFYQKAFRNYGQWAAGTK